MRLTSTWLFLALVALTCGLPLCAAELPTPPDVAPPGDAFELPDFPTAAGAPQIFEFTPDAGPDQTIFIVGQDLTRDVIAWGADPHRPGGSRLQPKVQLATERYLAVTLPEKAYDGLFVLWVKNAAGYSKPIVVNVPQPWWCGPNQLTAGRYTSIFGRNLARRPDAKVAQVYLRDARGVGSWVPARPGGKYDVRFLVPKDLPAGAYEAWVHAGHGGALGWGGPAKFRVDTSVRDDRSRSIVPKSSEELQAALDEAARQGIRTVELPEGVFTLRGTLRVPQGVTLRGASGHLTVLRFETAPLTAYANLSGTAWNQCVQAVHTPGDSIEYQLKVPADGPWIVWVRYATEMSAWKRPGMSGATGLLVDDRPLVPLENLPNTGSFGTFRWAKAASLELTAGEHRLVWKNVQGGGLGLDAFVFTRDPGYTPSDAPPPVSAADRIVLQGEDYVTLTSKEGKAPGADRAAVWLAGNDAAVRNLSIVGNAQINLGIVIGSTEPTTWLSGCAVQGVVICDCEGKERENCGILVRRLRNGQISDNEIWGRAPLFLSGARQTVFRGNRLCSVTRFGGNAEAAILGRNEPIEECLFIGNQVASSQAAGAGGPTARRLIWLSTGHGSIAHNWLSGNGVMGAAGPGAAVGAPQARFGGVAGTDQNVGETILFEANHRTMYFGPLLGGDDTSVTLPATLPATPDNRLGSVIREQLAHDAAGNETPFWPPDVDDGSPEPPIGEYFVSVFDGVGQGQTRRVVRREAERLILERPWRVAPAKDSVVAVGSGYYQNLIVGNNVPDGMTGIQLWISCMENVIAGNTIARQRKPGLFLFANGTTLASSMPRTWNRGISPLFWNIAEGNRADQCSDGALVTSGDAANLPIEFPRALGNTLRHNSFVTSRHNGVVITSRKPSSDVKDTAASVVGTVAEFNVVRDAPIAYHAGNSCDQVVLRRNHAYFWYPVNTAATPPCAFQVDNAETQLALEQNTIEGTQGVPNKAIVELKKSWEAEKPAAK